MVNNNSKQLSHILNEAGYLLLLVFLFNSCTSKEKETYTELKNGAEVSATFVGSETCKTCHQNQFKDWKGSHHDLAMQLADSVSVLGNFENNTFINKSIKSTFFKKGVDFYVNTESIDGNYADFKIEYTFGVTPLQQYLIKFPNGEYQCLTTAWDSVKNEWFSLNTTIDINHGDRLHWTGSAMSWNTMCADCHSTNLQKKYDSKTDTYQTFFSEINVSCEACHGPSSSHVSFYENPSENVQPPSMYMDSNMTSTEVVEKCARCHSRRSQLTKYFNYEGAYLDHYSPSLLVNPLYELDGQINDEVYVYGSFVQSKMYHNDVSCKDCHDVHSLKLKKQGNDLCMQCHTPNYNEPSHHFHSLNSEGSQCINCHMPGKLYMGNDFRRDHSFRVPRPDQTVAYGVPNSCNGCHTDKSPEWASEAIISRFGAERADHFSDHLLKGYYGDVSAFEVLMSNSKYPEIARATALNQYANQPLTQIEVQQIVTYLNDSSAVVRNEAIQSFERIQNTNVAANIQPLLNDSLRVVRISAAEYFNMLGIDMTTNKDFKTANKEFLDLLNMNADFAAGQHHLGVYYQAKGNVVSAIKSYERAIKIDGYYNRSRMNLALLYYQQGEIKESEQLYLKVIEQESDFGYSYYMLGLLYNEIENPTKALEYMSKAVGKEPANLNAYYNYALLLQQKGDYNTSLKITKKGKAIFPNNERLLYVHLIAELNTKNTNAIHTCSQLLKIDPNNQNYQQIFASLQ